MAERTAKLTIAVVGWLLLWATTPQPCSAQTDVLTLEQANERQAPAMTPLHDGEQVVLSGEVAGKPIPMGDFVHVPIVDKTGYGLIVEAPDFMVERVTPGDHIEVRGVLSHRGGLPIVRPVQLTTKGHGNSPAPVDWPITRLRSARALGLVSIVRGRVVGLGEDAGGEFLLVDAGQKVPYPIYLPRAAQPVGTGLTRFLVGDQVQATGVASIASEPPFDSRHRLVVASAASVALLKREWLVPPQVQLGFVAGLLLAALLTIRHRRQRNRVRRSIRRIHNFCEDLLTVQTIEELRRKLQSLAPRALDVSALQIYRYDRLSESLIPLTAPNEPSIPGSPLDAPRGSLYAAFALCFRNRSPLHIVDTLHSPLLTAEQREKLPRGVVLLPMFAREELVGVLKVDLQDHTSTFGGWELVALQHLANQVALVLKMVDQQNRREQLARSEKLAVTGQLISGVAGELKGPLDSILALSHRLLDFHETGARAILAESLKAATILSRLRQVAGPQQAEAAPLEINHLLGRVLEDAEWCLPEVELHVGLSPDPLWIMGVASQIEDVLGNLILLASQSAAGSQEPRMSVKTEGNSRRVLVGVRYGALVYDENFPLSPVQPGHKEALSFSLCRGIVHSLGGDVRILRAGETSCRMEIDLPAAFPVQRTETRRRSVSQPSSLTAILLEPEIAAQRHLVAHWSGRGHRAVPVSSEGEAFELLRRLKIEVVFCAIRTRTGSWVDFFDRVRHQTPNFVLLTDGIDSDAQTLFPEGEGFVLHKPFETGELEKLIDRIEQQAENLPAIETSSSAAT